MEKEEKMRLQTVRQMGIRYRQLALWVTAALVLAVLFACRVSPSCDSLVGQVVRPLTVSALFSLVASTAYGLAWSAVAKSSPASLAKFYLAASALKMMAAAVVFLVYVVVSDRAGILGFTVLFALFYVALLVLDCLFFARVERKNILNK